MKISKNRDLATKKNRRKKVFSKKIVENSIRAIRNAIVDPCTPLGPGEPFSRNLQFFWLSALLCLEQMVIYCSKCYHGHGFTEGACYKLNTKSLMENRNFHIGSQPMKIDGKLLHKNTNKR